jgi:hypothetical protein
MSGGSGDSAPEPGLGRGAIFALTRFNSIQGAASNVKPSPVPMIDAALIQKAMLKVAMGSCNLKNKRSP